MGTVSISESCCVSSNCCASCGLPCTHSALPQLRVGGLQGSWFVFYGEEQKVVVWASDFFLVDPCVTVLGVCVNRTDHAAISTMHCGGVWELQVFFASCFLVCQLKIVYWSCRSKGARVW